MMQIIICCLLHVARVWKYGGVGGHRSLGYGNPPRGSGAQKPGGGSGVQSPRSQIYDTLSAADKLIFQPVLTNPTSVSPKRFEYLQIPTPGIVAEVR